MDGNLNSVLDTHVIKMADDAGQSSSATNDAVSGTDNNPGNINKSHLGNFSEGINFTDILYCKLALLPAIFITIHCIQ